MSKKRKSKQTDPLNKWLALDWERPERSYNPDLRDFLANLLDYPETRVVTEDKGGGGYPDLKLLTSDKIAWVVGDLKKDDAELTSKNNRNNLWNAKRKYIDGLTRYVLFLTARYLWIVLPTGEPVTGFEEPLNLGAIAYEELKAQLQFISAEKAEHDNQWASLTEGKLPYVYLKLDDAETLNRLRQDLQASFAELNEAGEKAIARLLQEYKEYKQKENNIQRNLVSVPDSQRRALVRVRTQYDFHRHLFEDIFPRFEDQYGREVSAEGKQAKDKQRKARIREAFVADSVAVLIARVLFLRLVEDLGLSKKRRLSNGGPQDWAAFVEQLTGDARALVRLVAENAGRLYREPFDKSVFDWLYQTNGLLDTALQRLILRFNAYDFSGLSEEILGDIYQAFLPPAKRKRLGEFYTPPSIVDWLLEATVFSHGEGRLLDPSCGSGSFLVRYVHRVLEDAKARDLAVDDVLGELQTNVWGFDLNPFAAFISHFQLMWAMLRFKPTTVPPQVRVYNLNSLLRDDDLLPILGEGSLPAGSVERDREQWKYILGNPPYIRAERVKYGEEMKRLWQQVWGQNADTGLLFLYRALTESLEPGGFLGMVVSGGYANSEAAAKVWQLLYPGREAALRKLVWLEFVGRVWDAAVIPMLIVIERTPAKENDEIELYVPSTWRSNEAPVKVRYSDFFDAKVNPRVTDIDPKYPGTGIWGDYLLPLLHPDDVPILRKLHPNGNGGNVVELKEAVARQVSRNNRPFWWTYGIQLGREATVTETPVGNRSIQIIGGSSLAMGWCGEAEGWINLEDVQKLSIWREDTHPSFIAVAEMALVPFACVVEREELAVRNSIVVALPKIGGVSPKAIAAFLNSQLARFYYLIRLRSGVLEGSSRSHVYPRVLEALPWIKNLDGAIAARLTDGYNNLARLAATAKNNPDEWLLSEVETRIETKRYKLSDRRLGLNFSNWTDEEVPVEQLSWDGNLIKAGLFYLELVDANLAELVYKLLVLNIDEGSPIAKVTIQKLLVPPDYAELMEEYRQRLATFEKVEVDFFVALAKIDEAVYEMFGLTDAEKAHIETRLDSFPLNKLQPRYPWETVKPRAIKAYTEDRFG